MAEAQLHQLNDYRPKVVADINKGFDRIAHTLTDAIAGSELSGRELRICLAIITKTFRFHKKTDWICNQQLSDITGIAKNHVSSVKKSLLDKKIIVKNGREIGINTTISEWFQIEEKSQSGTKQSQNGTAESQSGTKQSQNGGPQKKNTITKETTTKKICSEHECSDLKPDKENPPKVETKSPEFIKLPLNKKNHYYSVTEDEVIEKINLYPAVNVRQEYKQMLDWLNSNPQRRKTASGIKAFITRWLGKRQNNPVRTADQNDYWGDVR